MSSHEAIKDIEVHEVASLPFAEGDQDSPARGTSFFEAISDRVTYEQSVVSMGNSADTSRIQKVWRCCDREAKVPESCDANF